MADSCMQACCPTGLRHSSDLPGCDASQVAATSDWACYTGHTKLPLAAAAGQMCAWLPQRRGAVQMQMWWRCALGICQGVPDGEGV